MVIIVALSYTKDANQAEKIPKWPCWILFL